MAGSIKGNTGNRTVLSQRQVLVCSLAVLCVLVGISMFREASLEHQHDQGKGISLWRRQHNIKTPPPQPKVVKRNKDGYRMCLLHNDVKLTGGTPIELGQDPVKMSHEDTPLPIRYQCAGMAYNQFATKLEEMVHTKASSPESQNRWGQREEPIPKAPYEDPRNILFFGSSHLRQVLAAFLCQYNDQVLSVKRVHGTEKLYSLNSFALKITLQHNIFIWAIINPSFVYTSEWKTYLENYVLEMPLMIMDLIVTNPLHHFHKQKYAQQFLDFLHDHGETQQTQAEGVTVNDDPPSFLDLTKVYDGRIVYVSSFAEYAQDHYALINDQIDALARGQIPPADTELKTGETHEIDWDFATSTSRTSSQKANKNDVISKQAESMFTHKPPPPMISKKDFGGRRRLDEEEEEDLPKDEDQDQEGESQDQAEDFLIRTTEKTTEPPRKNLIAIDGRQYVEELGECSTDSHKTIQKCITDTNHPRYNQGHKCFGSRGGHPDLLSYDLIEAIYKLFH